jgi:hypothetical protein
VGGPEGRELSVAETAFLREIGYLCPNRTLSISA